MSISLFCYTSTCADELKFLVGSKIAILSYFTSENFLISDIFKASEAEEEIAAEYGFFARNLFLVTLNQKNKASELQGLANIIKEEIGRERVLVLFENERVI